MRNWSVFPKAPRITAAEVQQLLKTKANVVVVDTDDSIAYDTEHIGGAVNMAHDPTVDPPGTTGGAWRSAFGPLDRRPATAFETQTTHFGHPRIRFPRKVESL